MSDEGGSLEPLDRWDVVFRGRFETHRDGRSWTVDVDFLDFGQRLSLYRDGQRVEVQKSPATFRLGPRARIEAAMGVFGMRRIDLVADGEIRRLAPVKGTLEARRLAFERNRPQLSRVIGAISWAVLVVAFITSVAELISLAGVDTPLNVPSPLGTIIGLAALAAALDRALRFKCNRWLD